MNRIRIASNCKSTAITQSCIRKTFRMQYAQRAWIKMPTPDAKCCAKSMYKWCPPTRTTESRAAGVSEKNSISHTIWSSSLKSTSNRACELIRAFLAQLRKSTFRDAVANECKEDN